MLISEQEAIKYNKDPRWRLNHLYKIRTKDRRLTTLKANVAQAHYRLNKSIRDIILKARQLGFTTEKLIEYLDDTIYNKNTVTAILAHKREKVQKLFEIVKLAYEHLPDILKPKVSFDNRNELYFPELNSKIYVTTETRSETVFNLHISEFAFMRSPREVLLAALESVPVEGRVSIESTANGAVGSMFEIWNDPLSEFKKHFYNWTWDVNYRTPTDRSIEELQIDYNALAKEYGLIPDIVNTLQIDKEQLNFYLAKIRRHKGFVKQEYPSTAQEAFISIGRNVFTDNILQKHQPKPPIEIKWGKLKIWEQPLRGFKYVMGIDTSEGLGLDNAVIEVFNAHTGYQVAEFADNNIAPSDLGRFAINVGKFYNNAFMVPEVNSSGISFLDSIKKVYYNIYKRESLDKRSEKSKKTLGWKTTSISKPKLVDNLVEFLDDKNIQINSEESIKEFKTFVRTEEMGKQGYGSEGIYKDDRVIAIGLAVQGIKEIPYMRPPKSIAQRKMEEYKKEKESSIPNIPHRPKHNKPTYGLRTPYGIKKY